MVGANISGDNQRPVHLQPSQLWMIPIVVVVEKVSASVASKLPGDQQGNARSNKLVRRPHADSSSSKPTLADPGREGITYLHAASSRWAGNTANTAMPVAVFFRMSRLHADSSSSKPTLADPGQEGITYLHAASSR